MGRRGTVAKRRRRISETRSGAALRAVSAAQKRRRALRRLSHATFVTIEVIGEILLWVLVTTARAFAWLLPRLARWSWNNPRPAASAGGVIVAAVLVIVFLVPAPPANYGDFDESLACMAENIYHEARGEPISAQIAVAKVVMNRVYHRRFPGTVCDVVKQGGEWPHHNCQFSWWCDGRSDAILDTGAMSKALSLAREVLSGDHDDPTDGAMWYHATRVSPDWRKDFAEGPTIGNHIFYRLQ